MPDLSNSSCGSGGKQCLEPGLELFGAGEEFELYGDGPKRLIPQSVGIELHQVFVGAQDGSHVECVGPLAERLQIGRSVVVVIGELAHGDYPAAAGEDRVSEGGRVADAAEERDGLVAQGFEGLGAAACREEFAGRVADFGPAGLWCVVKRRLADASTIVGRGHVGTGEDDHAGASELVDGFAEHSSGEEVSEAERGGGVEEHDIEVSGNTAVLEGVVEDEHLGVVIVDGRSSGGNPIGILQMGYVGEVVL